MKARFVSFLLAVLMVCPAPGSADEGDAQRVVALLDYVGGDYGRAVQGGRVVSPFEYDEQLRFLGDARRLAAPLLTPADAEVLGGIDTLEAKVRALAPPADVARASRAARDAAMRRFGLTATPPSRPSLARAEAIYAQNCVACHGERGDADTEVAAALDPQPASFRDPQRRQALSPYRVFNTLSFGVAGTAMASFGSLPAEDRWSLAFYVFRLGHDGAAVAAAAPTTGLGTLAARSDGELLEDLRRAGHEDADAVLATLRRETPFAAVAVATASPFDRTRALIAAARERFPADPKGADRLVLDAYLEGFEPMEAELSARSPALVSRVEGDFSDLRSSIAKGDAAGVEADTRRLLASLDRAGSPASATLPFVAAFIIYFREGVEAALLVGALLAGVRKLGRPEAARAVHAGWVLAVVAGIVTFWATERLLDWTSLQRELLEAGVSLAAALVLFLVSFWLISKAESRRWTDYLREQLARHVDGGRRVLVTLAFLAAYREAAETILFTRALLLDAGTDAGQVWAGAALGCLAFVAVALLLRLSVVRLPIGPFFAVSSVLLCLLAVSFAGSGLHALVAGGLLAPHPLDVPGVAWLGIHADLVSLLVQVAMVATIAGGGLLALRRRGDSTPAGS